MIPLYGFLEGDTVVLLVLASSDDTMDRLAERLGQSARVRVPPGKTLRVRWRGRVLGPKQTVKSVGIEALDRFDVVPET